MFASIRHTAIALAAAAATLGTVGFATAPAAAAGPAASQHTAAVAHGDLDLATAGDLAALRQRIRRAATSVCGSAETRDLAAMQDVRECRAAAIAGAQPKIALAVANAKSGAQLALDDGAPSIRVAVQ